MAEDSLPQTKLFCYFKATVQSPGYFLICNVNWNIVLGHTDGLQLKVLSLWYNLICCLVYLIYMVFCGINLSDLAHTFPALNCELPAR